MIWGLLIAVVLTVAGVGIAIAAKPAMNPSTLSWVVAVAGFLLLWYVGAKMVSTIEARQRVKAATEELLTSADGLLEETGLARLAKSTGLTQMAGDALRNRALGLYTKRIWLHAALLAAITLAMAIGFALLGASGGGRRPAAPSRERARRNSHRARRY